MAKKKIVLIHGFNVRDAGRESIDRLAPLFEAEGYEVDKDDADYGFHFLFKVRFPFLRKGVIDRIKKAIEHADIIITHSNGANYAFQALRKIGAFHKYTIIMMSPALNTKVQIPGSVRKAYFMATPSDFWTSVSRILVLHPWGAAGKKGYRGTDTRGTTIVCKDVKGHSGWFTKGKLKDVFNKCKRLIEVGLGV